VSRVSRVFKEPWVLKVPKETLVPRVTKVFREIRETKESPSPDLREKLDLRERRENKVFKDLLELMETVFLE